MKLKVEVTEECIGVKGGCKDVVSDCMVARAMKLAGIYDVRVGSTRWWRKEWKDCELRQMALPPFVVKAINDWCYWTSTENPYEYPRPTPFSFEVEVTP